MKADEMSRPDAVRTRVLEFLYGGMTPEQEAEFQRDLSTDEQLARCLAQERDGLHSLIPTGSADLPEGALQESRLLLRAALRRQRSPSSWRTGLNVWLVHLRQATAPRLALAGVAVLLLGVMLGRGPLAGAPQLTAGLQTEAGPADALVDVRVAHYDESSGRVELELTSLATTRVSGQLSDAPVQAALTAAMLGDLESAPRLLAVGLLRQQTQSAAIRTALTQALLKDDNPGVRMAAAGALSGLAADLQVRQALQQALLEDDNAGVRVAAIEGLRNVTDGETRRVLERVSHSEVNAYIRTVASQVLGQGTAADTRGPRHL